MKKHAQEESLKDLVHHLYALFETILEELREKYDSNDVVRIYIDHPNLEKAIIVTPVYLGDIDGEEILKYVDHVIYSSGDIPADEELDINVACVKLIGGSSRRQLTNIDEDIIRKKSLITIKNTDNSCLPRAIVVGLAKLKMDENPFSHFYALKYHRLRDSRLRYQGVEALKLRKEVNIPENREGLISDIPLYEKHLKVSIRVVSAEYGKCLIYSGSDDKYDRKIFLFHTVNEQGVGHFDTVTKMNALLCTQYYCSECNKGFKSKTDHKCLTWCEICGRHDCKYEKETICSDCNRPCRSHNCYLAHKEEKKGRGKMKNVAIPSYCQQYWKCPDCGITLKTEQRPSSSHECGEIYCKNCKQYHMDDNHLCYMRSINTKTLCNKMLFYDFECQQNDGVHTPNYVVVHSVCDDCESIPISEDTTCNSCGDRCNICCKFNKKENEYERNPCTDCGKRQKIFQGIDTINNFCSWLIHERNRNATAIAHNGRAYDTYFIYDYLMRNNIVPDPVIFTGSKIMYMRVGKGLNIRLLDSLNFLPMPLAKLPKSFGLNEKKKGFFPHFFNTPENENIVLPFLPDMKYYGPDTMSKSRREEFMTWYEENRNETFDFQKEMKEYCVSDVDILLNACCKFRQLLKEETGEMKQVYTEDCILKTIMVNSVDPFSFLTIASVCLGVFRSKFLPEQWLVLRKDNAEDLCTHDHKCECEWTLGRQVTGDSSIEIFQEGKWVTINKSEIENQKFLKSPIGLIPTHEYRGGENHSKESIEWLHVLEKKIQAHKPGVQIQHARNGGEKIVSFKGRTQLVKYKLDGFFEIFGHKYACEYHGCNWHGCPKCYKHDRESTLNNNKSLGQRYRETMLKEERLKKMGYNIVSIWSCDWKDQKKSDEMVQNLLKEIHVEDPISLRDCYFGGRTNGLTLHKVFKENEKGYYVDFTSLYPAVLKYMKYPTGHPIRIYNKFQNSTLENCTGNCFYSTCGGKHWKLPYFGIIKATFLPPKKLLHPILPLKCNKKLKFPLCQKCAEKENNNTCKCSDSQRSFTHTYCTPEVEVAINMGYKILKIHEVLHWNESEMYNEETKSGGLFTEYINTFLKLKQQASGFPAHVETEMQKESYINDYFIHEGVKLEKSAMKKNPGLRSLSKLALNSFYGKFGQRTNMKKTKFINNIADFMKLMVDKSKHVKDFHIMNENIIQVEYEQKDDFQSLSMNTNVTIAAFCTSYARLKLWCEMNKLGERVIYHDTDSIIFSVDGEGQYMPLLGDYLGQLTNELSCKELNCNNSQCTGHWIVEFISCGPKNYTYKLNTGEIVCKVRGFSLNYTSSQVINFESMKEALYSWKNKNNQELITIRTEIVRDKKDPKVYNRLVKKHYGVVYDKRRLLDDFTTLPFGYVE